MGVSLVSVIHNEEDRLPGMLEWHLPWVDECIIVHDGPCEDRSLDVARQHGCLVFEAPYQGYCEPLRQVGLSHAHNDWVLFVDADELFPVEFLQHARSLSQRALFDGVLLHRQTEWPDAPDRVAVRDAQLRFIRASKAVISPVIHTSPNCSGAIITMAYDIKHINLAADIPEKVSRYKRIIKQQFSETEDKDVRRHLTVCLRDMAKDG